MEVHILLIYVFGVRRQDPARKRKVSIFLYYLKSTENVLFAMKRKRIWRIYFGNAEKTKIFGIISIWLQSCQILQPGSYLDMTTALGLTPDSSSFKLHINFCCLIAKNFIWICRSKECFPIHNNFLFYLRHIYQLENKTPHNTKGGWNLQERVNCMVTGQN